MKIVKNQTTNVYYVRYNGQIEKAQLAEIGKVKMLCLLEHPSKGAPIPITSPLFSGCSMDEVIDKFGLGDFVIVTI